VENPSFSLEFHLPYYAWRRSKPIYSNLSSSIRRSEEVIYLVMDSHPSTTTKDDEDDDDPVDYIHEAQISVMYGQFLEHERRSVLVPITEAREFY